MKGLIGLTTGHNSKIVQLKSCEKKTLDNLKACHNSKIVQLKSLL